MGLRGPVAAAGRCADRVMGFGDAAAVRRVLREWLGEQAASQVTRLARPGFRLVRPTAQGALGLAAPQHTSARPTHPRPAPSRSPTAPTTIGVPTLSITSQS